MQSGYQYALERGYDIAVQVDGDGQHDPRCIARAAAAPARAPGARHGHGLALPRRPTATATAPPPRAGSASASSPRSCRAIVGQRGDRPDVGPAHDRPPRHRAVRPRLPARLPRGRGGAADARPPAARATRCPVRMRERTGGVSSINSTRSVYYMIKVLLAVFVGLLPRAPGGRAGRRRARRRGARDLAWTSRASSSSRSSSPPGCSCSSSSSCAGGGCWSATRCCGCSPRRVLLGLAVWRGLLEELATAVGIFYAPSALFAVAFGFVLVLLLHFSLVISRLAEQTKVLAQRVGLLQHEVDELREPARPRPPRPARTTREPARARCSDALTALAVVIVAHDSADASAGRRWRPCAPQLARRRRARGRRQRVARRHRARGARALGGAAVLELGENLGLRRRLQRRAPRRRPRRCCSSSTPTRCRRPGCLDALRAAAGAHPAGAPGRRSCSLPGGERGQHARRRRALARLRLGGRATASRSPTRRPRRPRGRVRLRRGAGRCGASAWDAVGGFDARLLHVRRGPRPVAAAAARGLGRRRRAGGARSSTTTSSPRATTSGSTSSATAGGRCSAPTRRRCCALLAPALLASELALLRRRGARRLAAGEAARAGAVLRELPAMRCGGGARCRRRGGRPRRRSRRG